VLKVDEVGILINAWLGGIGGTDIISCGGHV